MDILDPTSAVTTTEISDSPKTTSRLKANAEVAVIKKKHGDLEAIRTRMGLSRRKMCQLLLVDPSAWSRWNQPASDAPPHIYRALEWYLLLTEKEPRALLPIGSWSTTAFEDRFQSLETGFRSIRDQTVSLPLTSVRPRREMIWIVVIALIAVVSLVAGFVGGMLVRGL